MPATAIPIDAPPDAIAMKAASLRPGGNGVAIRWTIKKGWLPDGGFRLYRIERGGERVLLNKDQPLGVGNKRGNVKGWITPPGKPGVPAIDYSAALKKAGNPGASIDEKLVRPFSESRHVLPQPEGKVFEEIGKEVHLLRHTPGPSLPSSVAEMQIRKNALVASYVNKLLVAPAPPPPPNKPVFVAPPHPGAVKAQSPRTKPIDPVQELQSIRQNLLAGAFIHRDVADDLGLAFDDNDAFAGMTYQYELHSMESANRENPEVAATATIERVGADAPSVPAGLMAHQLDAENVALRWQRPTHDETTAIGMTSYEVYRWTEPEGPRLVSRPPIIVADMKGKDGIVEPLNFFQDKKVPVGNCNYKLVQTDMFGRKTESAVVTFTMEDWHMPAAPSAAQAELKDDDVIVTWCRSVPVSGKSDEDIQYRVYREDIEQTEKEGRSKAESNSSVSSKVVPGPGANEKKTKGSFTSTAPNHFRNSIGADWQLLTTAGVKGESFSLAAAKSLESHSGGRVARAIEKSTRPGDWVKYVDTKVEKDHKYRYFVTAFYPKNNMETTGTGTTTVLVPTKVVPPPPANLNLTVQVIPPPAEPTNPAASKASAPGGASLLLPTSGGKYVIPGKNERAPITLPASFRDVRSQDTGATVTISWDEVTGTPPISYRVYRGSATGLFREDKAKGTPQSPPPQTSAGNVNARSNPAAGSNSSASKLLPSFNLPAASLSALQIGPHTLNFYQELTAVQNDSFVLLGEVRNKTSFVDDIPRSQAHTYFYRVIAVSRWGLPAGGPKEGISGAEKKVRVPATLPPSAPVVLSATQDDVGNIDLQFRPNIIEESVEIYEVKRRLLPATRNKQNSTTPSAPTKSATKGGARFGIHPPESAMQLYLRENPGVQKTGLPLSPADESAEKVGTVNPNEVVDGVLQFRDTNVSAHPNQLYSYYIVAINHDGLHSRSGNHLCSATTSVKYPGPATLTPVVSCESVKLSWPATQDVANGYIVQRAQKPGQGNGKPVDAVQLSGTVTATSYTDYSVQPGQSYVYRVIGVTKEGNVTEPTQADVTVPAR